MGGRVNGLGALLVIMLVAAAGWSIAPAGGVEAIMCPPVTIDDMFPEEPPETTTTTTATTVAPTTTVTTAPTTTVTTVPSSSSTTAPATTVTTTPTTSTSEPPETTTTVADTTTTTAARASSSTTSAGAPTTTTNVPTTTSPTTTTTEPPEPECNTPFVYPMVFPLLGAGDIGSHFGAPRDGGRRHHLGNDIFAPVLQPVAAVADGTVTRVAGDTGISGYRVHIRHDDGWSSLYIHLNNDTAGTDDGNGIGIRPGLQEGDRVSQGEVIGWNGDSGNAESTVPHLHFELRDPSGTSVDPQASLEAAPHLPDGPFTGPFSDISGEGDVNVLTFLLSRGVSVWCDETILACSSDPATAGDVVTWLEALVGEIHPPSDPSTQVTEADVARLIAWDRLNDMYADQSSWLGEGLPDRSWSTPVSEPPADPLDVDLAQAYAILGGSGRCLALPDDSRNLTREAAAQTVALYLGWSPGPTYCPTSSAKR